MHKAPLLLRLQLSLSLSPFYQYTKALVVLVFSARTTRVNNYQLPLPHAPFPGSDIHKICQLRQAVGGRYRYKYFTSAHNILLHCSLSNCNQRSPPPHKTITTHITPVPIFKFEPAINVQVVA